MKKSAYIAPRTTTEMLHIETALMDLSAQVTGSTHTIDTSSEITSEDARSTERTGGSDAWGDLW